MEKHIFQNSKQLSSWDIYLTIPAAIGFSLLIKILYPLHKSGGTFTWSEFFIWAGVLITIWTINALLGTTLKTVKLKSENHQVSFVIQRQLKGDRTINLNLNSISLELKTEPSRSLQKNHILIIKDNINEVKISSTQKGLSEQILKEIAEKLETYRQQGT